MKELHKPQEIYRYFTSLVSYPTSEVKQTASACQAKLMECYPETAELMSGFINFLEKEQPTRVEEVFTATFDMQPLCFPYVGYQLFGDNQQRTMFLVSLNKLYRQHDFATGVELPDHLSEVLRFIGMVADQSCHQEIIQDGLLPALEKILQGFEAEEHPYGYLLKALQSFLIETVETETKQLADSR